MSQNDSRRGATDMGMPLMIVAFVVIGGFMWWLSGQAAAENEARAIAEAEAAAAAAEAEAREALVLLGDVTAIGSDPEAFVGEEIHADGHEVASLFGSQGFWVNTETGNPFLVVWSDELIAEGASVTPGDTIDGYGGMMRMDPAHLDEWTGAGTITEGDRVVGEFATHFVEAHTVTVLAGPSAGGNDGGAGDEGEQD